MQVTLDIKDLLIGLLIIAAVVLLIFLSVLVANAIKSVKKLNGILDDASTVTGIVHEKAEETKPPEKTSRSARRPLSNIRLFAGR